MSLVCILDLADLIVIWRHRQKTRRQRNFTERRMLYLPVTATYRVPVSTCCHLSNQLRLTNSCFAWILWSNLPQSYSTQTVSNTSMTNRDLTENNGIWAQTCLPEYYTTMFGGILLHSSRIKSRHLSSWLSIYPCINTSEMSISIFK